MINPQFEIDRLKQNLMFGGYDQREVEVITDNAHKDINMAIANAVSEAMGEAARISSELGVGELSGQLRAVRMGSTYQIVTDSGQTDFSTPAYPMLPKLLKNAKRAKDGSLYKVIPLKEKAKLTNIFDVQRNIDENRKAMVEAVQSEVQQGVSVVKHAGAFSGLAAAQAYINRRNEIKSKQADQGEVKFRTASSKQDPTKLWVQPPKDKNLSTILVDLNRKLEDDIQSAVTEIVATYESQFLRGGR